MMCLVLDNVFYIKRVIKAADYRKAELLAAYLHGDDNVR